LVQSCGFGTINIHGVQVGSSRGCRLCHIETKRWQSNEWCLASRVEWGPTML
jgi:hypothetical protein